MPISFCSLGSGSKGNAVLVSGGGANILIDCGLSIKTLVMKLLQAGLNLTDIDAVLITHEHSDHIKSAAELSDGFGIPLYTHKRTARVLKDRFTGITSGRASLNSAVVFDNTSPFDIKGLTIEPFRNPHDAVFPLGYTFTESGNKAVYATDLGEITPSFLSAAEGAKLVMLESNYDFNMLINGRYPEFLKRRILSVRGHLSNEVCADTVAKLLNNGAEKFILGHISQENNLPELVFETVTDRLKSEGAEYGKDYKLAIATQSDASEILEISL